MHFSIRRLEKPEYEITSNESTLKTLYVKHFLLHFILHVKMAGYGLAVGIDLGTTYSCVGVWQQYRVEIIGNDQGNRTTPSCVAFTHSDHLIGDAAVDQAALNPLNTIFGTHIYISYLI